MLGSFLTQIQLKAIEKKWDELQIVADFSVQSSERVALIGPSGSGKTTILRMIAGLEQPDQGTIFFDENRVDHLPTERRNIGYVFQESTLLPHLSVFDNVTLGLRFRKVKKEEQLSIAQEWLEKVDLWNKRSKLIQTLSGGERQRAAFVQMLIYRPQLLLLDEPWSSLDPASRTAVQQNLVELHSLWPVPLIFVTHDERDIESLGTGQISLSDESWSRNVLTNRRKFIRSY